MSLAPTPALAACSGVNCAKAGAKAADTGSTKKTPNDLIKSVVNVLLFITGAIAVVMIVLGGLKYTTSNGDSNQVTSAKNTILYAVIGLIVAIMAYAIVNFVITSFV